MWEVFSGGRRPYGAMKLLDVKRAIHAGNAMALFERPEHCPSSVYAIVKRCLRDAPSSRLRFSEAKMLMQIEMLPQSASAALSYAANRAINPTEFNTAMELDVSSATSTSLGSRHISQETLPTEVVGSLDNTNHNEVKDSGYLPVGDDSDTEDNVPSVQAHDFVHDSSTEVTKHHNTDVIESVMKSASTVGLADLSDWEIKRSGFTPISPLGEGQCFFFPPNRDYVDER